MTDVEGPAADPLWYKDAVIYQLHLKSFFDSNNDGIGDFEGLLAKLDYIVDLGVTTIWLLPFYPSPRRDDGYDIAEYRDVSPITARSTTSAPSSMPRTRAACASSPNSSSTTRRTSTPGSRPRARPPRAAPSATSTSGPTTTRSIPARGSSSSTPKSRTGRGTRRPAIFLAPLLFAPARSQFRQSCGDGRGAVGDALLARSRHRRAQARRDPLSDRARRHLEREFARDARGAEADPRRSRRALSRSHAARRGEHVARGHAAIFRRNDGATNATWRSTSR